jgi:hypothetical protein
MTLFLYLQCVLMFIGGQAIHLFLVKIPALKKRARAANKDFAMKEYWAEDWPIVVGTQVVGMVVILGLDQIVHWKPVILDWVKWWFALLGAFGSTVIMSRWSPFEKKLLNVIDVKTNIADGVTNNSN